MKIYKEIVRKLDDELNILEIETEDILVKAEKGIKLTKQALKDIRNLVTDCEFKTAENEINFFLFSSCQNKILLTT
ncbi:hypothetical protein [Polaribacter cellanae]|uniref:Uncharacterized protein n=1 Tax=Polaribacter cellanae TaxID=2818493 RepID=A0A975CPZ2_9FLAO|nr:hypothetical protein [Polaribacter cellanae]QTE23603.1 hypothetical protein J3359_04800 [Polaribacter cellanae]